MHTEWKEFLRSRGAIVENGRVLHFGAPREETRAAASGNVIADLSHWALIRAEGKDAETFLQSQFSNDLRLLNDTSQLHGYCNAQGRMLAILRIFRRDGALMLQLPASLADTTLKRLRMFVLRAQVTLTRMDDALVTVGLSGPGLATLLQAAGLTLPGSDACNTHGDITVLRLPGLHPRAMLVGPPHAVEQVWRAATGAHPVGASAWSWLDIAAGLPVVRPETVEAFVPQMTNLDLVGGISFKKGCYPGQEIVARTHYLGRLKQRMYRARLDADACPRAGDAVFAPDFGDQAAGTVVEAQPSPAGGCEVLAVIQISSARSGDLHLARPDGAPLTLIDLPYALPTPP